MTISLLVTIVGKWLALLAMRYPYCTGLPDFQCTRARLPRLDENSDKLFFKAEEWTNQGRQVAIATVVETWGSSPRPCGSQLLIDSSGNFIGSVSGGCVEAAVISEGMDVIKDALPRLLEFGVTNEMAWEVGLACGGHIRVYVEAVQRGAD